MSDSEDVFCLSKDYITICPLGGVGQIGMNWTLYGYDNKWILVDVGVKFASKDYPELNTIFPNPKVIDNIIKDISGVILTHAHEDHIGAIHEVFPKLLNCPIYATNFTYNVVKRRLKDRKILDNVNLIEVNHGIDFNVGSFCVKPIQMTHSIPDSISLELSTPIGSIFHTGDWRVDNDSITGDKIDIDSLISLSKKNVLVMLSDSTNSLNDKCLISEMDIKNNINNIFKEEHGLIIATCFSTNISRLISFYDAAIESNRSVFVIGSSIIKMIEEAKNSGYIDKNMKFITDIRMAEFLNRDEMIIICSGSQGEYNSAFSKIATNDYKGIPKIQDGDLVLISARTIPGNEKEIEELLNQYKYYGAKIYNKIDDKGNVLHVTGHACKNEMEDMYKLIKPKCAIPIHGDYDSLKANIEIAEACGIKNTVIPEEGDVFRVNSNKFYKCGKINIELLATKNEGNGLIEFNENKENVFLKI